MKSSTGQHWIALDHVRAFAAFTVFTWHFIHARDGTPVPFDGAPGFFPLAILDEGHTGVALFMTLSGYLFSKLLDGGRIKYFPFLLNRFLRLAPLLLLVVIAVGVQQYLAGEDLKRYILRLFAGAVMPTLPNGGWSITAEVHFYLILPMLILLIRKWSFSPLVLIAAALALRSLLYVQLGQIQMLSYLTIIGRFDQFLLGMFAYSFGHLVERRHFVAVLTFVLFALFYWWFDSTGGYYALRGEYPTTSPLWIIMPTIEGTAYAVLIAYYDRSFRPSSTGISGIIEKAGSFSYSIYLLHFFVVFEAARLIDAHVMPIGNFYVACAWAALCFGAMIPIGYASFKLVERPFLKFRIKYIEKNTELN